MSLNESHIEEATLEWPCLLKDTHRRIGELGYAIGHGPDMAPGKFLIPD